MEDYFFFFQIAALIIFAILFRKLKHTFYRWFLPYLIIVILYEYGSFSGWFTVNRSNHWSFNIISTLEFLFYGMILQHLLTGKNTRRFLWIALAAVLVITLINITAIQGFWKLHTHSYLLQSVTIITACCIYFYQLMQQVKSETPLLRNPDFWLCTGILFYYLGGFMFFASFSHLVYKENSTFVILYLVIYNMYNIVLYSCLIRSFLCFRQRKT